MITCGDEEVAVFEKAATDSLGFVKVWEWTASMSEGLPEDFHDYFNTTDECKPVGENQILITSSSGGVALVNRDDKKTVFYAHAPNAHSAEYLPGNKLVVALSTAKNGNSIRLYDLDHSDSILFTDSLYSGHGVVWDEQNNSLFALGFDLLREYKLEDWDSSAPWLKQVSEWEIPDESGHDLFLTDDSRLLLSTTNSVWQFDINRSIFSPFPALEGVHHVKSVNLNAQTGELVYTKGEISWWTHHVYMHLPKKDTLALTNKKIYKVRVM
ncbi:hypothetical protein GCM10027284_27440 [Cyclobacterium sediminis]